MAIVKMKKLTLLGMDADKEAILNAFIRSKSVQLKRSADIDSLAPASVLQERESLTEKIAKFEDAITYLKDQTSNYNSENKKVKDVEKAVFPKDSFARPLTEIHYDDFLSLGDKSREIEQKLDELLTLRARQSELTNLRVQKKAEYDKVALFSKLPHPTTWYRDTESSIVQLSQAPASELENINTLAKESELVSLDVIDINSSFAILVVVAHKSEREFWEKATSYGLVKSSLSCDVLPQALLEDVARQLAGIDAELKRILAQIVEFDKDVPLLKIYIDYLSVCDKKLSAEGDMLKTLKTFVLEAYYPAEEEEKINSAISSVSDCVSVSFDEIAEDEFAPTLVKNNKVVRAFEGITNMYSPPAYRGLDPNPVMSVFYFLIFGFMVADIGYGALLVIAGLFATFVIKQQTGLKTMLQMFGMCGIGAIAVGAMFGSCFCFQLYDGIFPAPDKYPMVMMILSLILGIIHICAGIACKMALKIKRKQRLAAWLCDFPWIVVFAAFVLAIFNSALDMAAYEPYNSLHLPNIVSQISLYVCLAALAVALIFAGLGSKGILGKLTKSFGAAYGIINYFSDIMSYIRVFGLMLSSALVGSVINNISQMVMSGGGAGYALAFVVLIAAHLFNLAMGVLSVYIHNGRLQYVEFYGKFYEGDGELFVPFCSDTKYTLLSE